MRGLKVQGEQRADRDGKLQQGLAGEQRGTEVFTHVEERFEAKQEAEGDYICSKCVIRMITHHLLGKPYNTNCAVFFNIVQTAFDPSLALDMFFAIF